MEPYGPRHPCMHAFLPCPCRAKPIEDLGMSNAHLKGPLDADGGNSPACNNQTVSARQTISNSKTVTEHCQCDLSAQRPFSWVEPARALFPGSTTKVPTMLVAKGTKQYIHVHVYVVSMYILVYVENCPPITGVESWTLKS